MSENLALFVRESNWIEGIRRDPTVEEIRAHAHFLSRDHITPDDLVNLVRVVQPNAVLRDDPSVPGVQVGNHIAPPSSPAILYRLGEVLFMDDIYDQHVAYETLHPFTDGNGRSGRALWLHSMGGKAPLGFLHHWYYQSLQGSRA